MTRIFKTASAVFPVFLPFSWILPFLHSYTSDLFRWAVSIGFLIHTKIAFRPWRFWCALEAMNSKSYRTKFFLRSIPVKLCETGRREAVLLVVCFLVIVHESENFYISCDKERFLLFYSKADFRILGKVSDIKCHLCRCPLKWTTCW